MSPVPPGGPPGAVGGPPPDARDSDAALARRAQILATEHWGLLAARGTAQSEVLTRITIYLTLVSASLVTIGLLGQATGFDDWFAGAALAILALLTLLGLMTQMRVFNVSEEDFMYVVAMNRLRGAYADLDPDVERYFLAAVTDDEAGLERTYSFFRRRSFSHLFGSSAVFISVVNACVIGLFFGGCLILAGVSISVAVILGTVVALAFVALSFVYGFWTYRVAWRNHQPLRRAASTSESRRAADPAESRRAARAAKTVPRDVRPHA